MSENCILITGADGYIGSKLTRLLLNDGSYSLVLWVRADDETEAANKRAAILARYREDTDKITVITSNFQQANPFQEVNADQVTHIVHCAAVIRFNVESELADSVNREGTRKVLDFARECKQLQRFIHLSTLYASGLATGKIDEILFAKTGPFANHYERSKCEAEHIINEEYSDLPWQILRLATVIADNDKGEVSQYNVFHNTMHLLFHGLISLVPGEADVPLYFVTGDFSAKAIYDIIRADYQPHSIYHIGHREEESITLQSLLDCCFTAFSKQEVFRKRNILKPLLTDLETFKLLGEGLTGLSASIVSQAVNSIQPFAPQLFIHKAFANDHLVAAIDDYQAPQMMQLTENVVQHLIDTQWGRKQ
jgi:nucleoside-diphosphate-sugar epimerase